MSTNGLKFLSRATFNLMRGCTINTRHYFVNFLNNKQGNAILNKCVYRNSSNYLTKTDANSLSSYACYLNKLHNELQALRSASTGKSFDWPKLLYYELGGKANVATDKLRSIVEISEQLLANESYHRDAVKLADEAAGDEDLLSEVKHEMSEADNEIQELRYEIVDALVKDKELEDCSGAILEVRAGVGGTEAMIFASELYEMYRSFCHQQGFETKEVDSEMEDGSHLLKASCIISSEDGFAYSLLRHEAGVHRVQRVPKTEKRGRIHTSTASVAVIPKHDGSTFKINPKDVTKHFTHSPGGGGQHVNKTLSCAVVRHEPSGTQVRCHATRVAVENLNRALLQLTQILQKQHFDEMQASTNAARAEQTRSRERSDKIRTYNYHQDRITEHRLGKTFHGISEFLSGGQQFVLLLRELDEKRRKDEKIAVINSLFKEAGIA